MNNILEPVPMPSDEELIETILSRPAIRIERIVSNGHVSPQQGWYDQQENEWVLVLEGSGTIQFADGREIKLQKGDYLEIPAHEKHRVTWTEPDACTIWLAVFF